MVIIPKLQKFFSQNVKSDRTDRRLEILLGVVVVATFVSNWLGVFQINSWSDELTTIWVIRDSVSLAFSRAFYYQGGSPLYYLIAWCASRLMFGQAELAIRILSALCTLLTTVYIYRLCRSLASRETSLIACQFFQVLCRLGYVEGFSGRPYALGVMCVFISLDCYLRWVISEKNSLFVGFFLSSLLIPYIHPFFNIVFLLHALITFLYWDMLRDRLPLLIKSLFLFAILASPNALQFKVLVEKRTILAFPMNWSVAVFLLNTQLVNVYGIWLIPIGGLWTWNKLEKKGRESKSEQLQDAKPSSILIALSISLIGGIVLSVASIVFGNNIFLPRYTLYSLGGLAILLALLNSTLTTIRQRIAILFFSTALVVLFAPPLPHLFVEDWPGVLRMVKEHSRREDLKFIDPCILENRSKEWSDIPEHRDYLLSLVTHYKPDQTFLLFPWDLQRLAIFKSESNSEPFSSSPQIGPAIWPEIWIVNRLEGPCRSLSDINSALATIGYKVDEVTNFGSGLQLLRCSSVYPKLGIW